MRRNQLFSLSLVLGLTACGGGGGGSSGSGGGGNGTAGAARSPVPPQTAITYSGSTTPATISATSAGMLASSVIGSSGAAVGGNALTGVSVQPQQSTTTAPQPSGATGIARRLAQAIHSDELGRASNGGAVTGAVISPPPIACDSGSIVINGTVNDSTGAGTGTVDFVDCRTGSDTLNGPAALRIDSYDQTSKVITDGTMTFTRVRFTGPGVNFDLSGTLRTQISLNNQSETLTENITTQDNSTGRQTQVQNLTFNNIYDNVRSPTFFTQDINGNVCDGTAGCVNVSTQTAPHTSPWGPLYYATSAQAFPDWGIINLAAGTGRVKITALGVDLAKVEVDAAGDGTYENSARMRWSDLGSSISADLADNDGDGMHNSWEAAKGLNPNDPSDRNADPDLDGASNIAEYYGGSDPSTNGSLPSNIRHLWITDVSDLAFDPASGQINAFIGGSTTSGALIDPLTGELGADFSAATVAGSGSGTRTIVDGAGRTYTLSPTASPTTWTLSSSNGATVTVNNVAGTNAGSLVRYPGGLAFRTVGTASPGYVYLVNFP